MSNNASKASRYPSRRSSASKAGKYKNQDGDVVMKDEKDEVPVDSDDPSSSDELGEDEQEFERLKNNRRRGSSSKEEAEDNAGRRKSMRANKFQKSMKEPQGISEFSVGSKENDDNDSLGKKRGRKSSVERKSEKNARNVRRSSQRDSLSELDGASGNDDEGDETEFSGRARRKSKRNSSSQNEEEVPSKASKKPRRKPPTERDSTTDDDDDKDDDSKNPKKSSARPSSSAEEDSMGEEESSEEGSSDDEDPVKIQRIIGSKSERRKVWKEICSKMNTHEIDSGSLWHQKENKTDADDDAFEERFLVKWTDMSYLHCSWETAKDLEDQTDNAKTYLSTFFRKSKDGVFFSPEERCDGDYFDPAFVQIDRIMEVDWMGMDEWNVEDEDKATLESLGIVTDKEDPGYEEGLGREFYIKWGNTPYDESTFEYERDLILNDIDYKEQLKAFLKRKKKPSKKTLQARMRTAEVSSRKLAKIFGEGEERGNVSLEQYQKSLRETVFKNGGQLRDYQAEGVSWMISNYLNKRSCILADEMGLGKTLQTAATVNIIQTQLHINSCCLIIAPLSTIPHWLREFQSWTDLNVIVYHGSAEDRRKIREWEMAYEEDRPRAGVSNFLRRCKKNMSKLDSPWMVQVVIATPEMLVTEDAFELSAIQWEVLVVDEAHRLKNHNSKLAATLRDTKFTFNYRILCTGTPIQNDMKELWTLLHFIDAKSFGSVDEFLEKFGEMKTKETVDELHETLRPYILRRLKEDVEKDMPPKEETIIEVELTLPQKQYYRALYEKNVKFLHKGKSRSLDGPSLNNLAMQLRKCCNHVCLLNGIEDELRKQHAEVSDPDFLIKGSGKFVLLDKLLPRLKEEGHRVLIFSQFKIMLDILEDYLDGRGMTFGRIDGSITGLKRQAAIDAFQSKKENAPFIMMLSTRAGGVGINLTAADTVIIFDSDWNPQNDLQAQARCHRIGQKRAVKVYRLLSARTYEMHMFNLSSKKMGLDQAVLRGFESNAEGSLTKAEIENLLKNGAYSIMAEEKDGKSEITSNEFVEQDIDSILARRTRTIVHDGGSEGGNAGGTFSKASFKMTKSPGQSGGNGDSEDVDIDDPDFWKKMLGDSYKEDENEDLHPKRRRCKKDYSEVNKGEGDAQDPDASDLDYSYQSDATSEDEISGFERIEWGGSNATDWKREQVEKLERLLYSYGYGNLTWGMAMRFLNITSKEEDELKRMAWSLVLGAFLESAQKDAIVLEKRAQKSVEKQEVAETSKGDLSDGGVLASRTSASSSLAVPSKADLINTSFQKLWSANKSWVCTVLEDAVCFAKATTPRDNNAVANDSLQGSHLVDENTIREEFGRNVWKSLQHRGWKATLVTEGPYTGRSVFSFRNESFGSIDQIVRRARTEHPELAQALDNIITLLEARDQRSEDSKTQMRLKHLSMTFEAVTYGLLESFLNCYAPRQLLADKGKGRSASLCSRRLLFSIPVLSSIFSFVRAADLSDVKDPASVEQLVTLLGNKPRQTKTLPHHEWTCCHDAVLLLAIYRHGNIELEENHRGIINDKSITWGPPFDSLPVPLSTQETDNQSGLEIISRAAKRAADLLGNDQYSEETKNLNKHFLIEHFCLQQVGKIRNEGSALLTCPESWLVDSDALMKKFRHFERVAVPLPHRIKLAKRANSLSTCLQSSEVEAGPEKPNQAKDHSFGIATLDQKQPANALLVELIRSLLRAQTQNRESKDSAKNLCSLIVKEVRELSRETRETLKANADEMKMACDNAELIVKNIKLVESSLSLPPRLFKNVLRVLLGEQPVPSKSQTEPLFPPEPRPDMSIESSGRRAIEAARKKSFKKGATTAVEGNDLVFTETETLIFSAACSRGIPVWSPGWQELVSSESSSEDHTMSWREFCQHVIAIASWTHAKALKVYEEASETYHEKTEPEQETEASFLSAKQSLENIAGAQDQLHEYEEDPLSLAKKTILLLAKMLKKATTHKPDHDPSHKILKWLNAQVSFWAGALGLFGHDGEPLALSALDFFEDVPQEQQSFIELSSCFDKQECWEVLDQISYVSRLRVFFICSSPDVLSTHIQLALDQIRQSDGGLTSLHDAWKDGVDDILLARRLLNVGFYALSGSTQSLGSQSKAAKTSFRKLFLSEGVLQTRVNQLVRGLHDSCESLKSEVQCSSDGKAALTGVEVVGVRRGDDDCATCVKVVGARTGNGDCGEFNLAQDMKRKLPDDLLLLNDDSQLSQTSSEKKIRFV